MSYSAFMDKIATFYPKSASRLKQFHPDHTTQSVLRNCRANYRALLLALILVSVSTIIRSGGLSPVRNRANIRAYFSLPLDDPHCLSRTQLSLLKSQASELRFPAQLAVEWERYGELYRRCAAGNNWTELLSNDNDEAGCRYVLFLDSDLDGLGNRFMALASALAYALATDRVILIDNRRKLGDLLCEPFHESNWILPDDFPFQDLQNRWERLRFVENRSNSSIVKLDFWDTPSVDDIQLFCEDNYNSLVNVRLIAWVSDLYITPNLFLVPSFWERMRTLFPDPEQVFAHISRLVLLPANDIWAIVLKEYRSYLSCSKSRVGVQIRLHGRPDRTAFDVTANNMIMECLVNSSFVPQVSSNRNSTDLATLYSRKLRAGDNEVDVAVLVTSLNGQYFEKIKELYSQNLGTVDGRIVRVHSVSQLKSQDFSFRQSQIAFAEMWLLSYTDALAISASSTFGYAAMSWGNLRPLILDFTKLTCRKGYSVDPCTHLSRKPTCLEGARANNLSSEHKRWIKRHLSYCQDRPGQSWQLVQPDGFTLETILPVPEVFEFDSV